MSVLPRDSNRGFSLVELLVATAIGAMVTLLVATVFANSSKTSAVTQSAHEIQEQGAVALEMLQRDVRVAGFSGCNSNRMVGSGGLVNTIATPTGYLNAIDQFVIGYEGLGGGTGFSPAAPGAVTGATPAPLDESDVLTVRIPAREPVAVSATMASASAVIPVFSTAGFVAGTRAVVSDCAQTAAFVVTGLAGGLQHTVGGSTNSTANLQRAFGVDAMAVPMQTITYYVGRSSIAPVGDERSLWRRVDTTAASEEVAEGVEEFRVLYGTDTDDDRSADVYDTADNVADWSQVVAVRVSLLLRSKSPNAARNPQAFDFNGQVDVVPGDLRLRRPLNVTILLRNRTP